MATHRQIVVQRTRLFQALVVLLFGVSTAGLALPMGGVFAPDSPSTKTSGGLIPAPPPSPPDIDTTAAAETLLALTHWKKIETPPPADTTAGPGGPEVKPQPSARDWAYAGSMLSPESRAAIVKIDGEQRRLREGEKVGDTTLVSIEPDAITIRVGQDEKRITLETRSQTWPTSDQPKLRGPAAASPVRNGVPVGMPGAGQPMSPAQYNPGGIPKATPVSPTFDGRNNPNMNPNNRQRGGSAQPAGQGGPGQSRSTDSKFDPATRDGLVRQLQQPEVPAATKSQILRQLGIVSGMDPSDAAERLRVMGVNTMADPTIGEALKITVGSGP